MKTKIYIAGPDVFAPDVIQRLENKKNALKNLGFIPLSPFDNEVVGNNPRDIQGEIFVNNLKKIQEADVILANLNEFRGDCMDDGTAFEIGYGVALKKIVIGYRADLTPMAIKHGDFDKNGWKYENFGNPVNLMIDCSCSYIAASFEEACQNIPILIKQ